MSVLVWLARSWFWVFDRSRFHPRTEWTDVTVAMFLLATAVVIMSIVQGIGWLLKF